MNWKATWLMPEAAGPQFVISNTTPIIALSLIGQLNLLQILYGQVAIPPAVEAEILAGGPRAGAAELQAAAYIQTTPLTDPHRADLLSDLDQSRLQRTAKCERMELFWTIKMIRWSD